MNVPIIALNFSEKTLSKTSVIISFFLINSTDNVIKET